MTERYVLKYHPVLEDGQRSVLPVNLGSDLNGFGSIFMYYFAKFFASRKRDFVVENTKKKVQSKASTTVNSNVRPSKNMALMEDANIAADDKKKEYPTSSQQDPPMYESIATDQSMTTSMAIDSKGNYSLAEDDDVASVTDAAHDAAADAAHDTAADVEAIQINVEEEEEEEEVDQAEILKDISKF
jgi:hypothetical protein